MERVAVRAGGIYAAGGTGAATQGGADAGWAALSADRGAPG